MKFVCDKCKTRYSIGEDRVRGKILKIRCKNCANVITVREGMEEGAATADAPGRNRPITAQPPIGSVATAKRPSPLPAPAALDQEWYVSIDGVQSGPFLLAEAQKWVASKPFEADLHCWSEGFDDWLSVDKVSHFRNLRKPKPPAPSSRPKTIPPPIPTKEEQKPLFASTMAAIEKDVASSSGSLPIAKPSSAASSGQMTNPALSRVNGAGAAPLPKPTGSGSMPASPARTSSPSGRFNAQKGPGHAALAAAFDTDDSADSHTQLDAPPFASAPESRPVDPFAAFEPKAEPARPTVKQALESDDDDLAIGEVSRVVKLADIVPKPRPAAAASTGQTGAVNRISTTGLTGSVPRIGTGTASHAKLSPTELGMNVDPSLVPVAPDESMVAQSFAQRHRRGMIALIAFAGLLVLGVIGVVFYITSKQTDEIGGGLGGTTRTIDTSRPEDIVKRQLPPTPGITTPGSNTQITQRPRWTGTRPNNPTGPVEEDPKGLSLKASEIEDMAAKQGEGTKRCYMRAQKGALGFEIAEIKKIAVTLTVGKDGVVSNVELSSHANDSFGQCLISRIKGWRFRESPGGGTFRISLAFSS